MSVSVFEFRDYKDYLRAWIAAKPNAGRGFRSKLAKAMGCQMAYLTRVLNDQAHLSYEQLERTNQFLEHSQGEGDFLLLLLLRHRAGSADLAARLDRQISDVLEKRLQLKHRLGVESSLSREDQATYYSTWHYSAVHMLLSIPEFQTKEAIARRVGLPLGVTSQVLDFLVSKGLAGLHKDRYRVGKTHIHLEGDSPLISKHHTNWRMQAVRSLDRILLEDLHYSSVITMSVKDRLKVRNILVKTIEQIRAVVKESPEEELFSYSIDFFEVR